MDLKEFNERLSRFGDEIEAAIDGDIADIVGTEAVNHYQEGFDNEGFTDQSPERWPEVKRRQGKGKGADAMRKILTGRSGALRDSIRFDKEPGKVIVSANPLNAGAGDFNYAPVHNFGVSDAGRNRSTTIPKRQFIGRSTLLDRKIAEQIKRWISDKLSRF